MDDAKAINIGVAAHITAAAPGGPRYDPALTPEERSSAANGIWLCQSCGKLLDNDPERYAADILRRWKLASEEMALLRLENPEPENGLERSLREVEELMPALLDEMAADVRGSPLLREFILVKRAWSYWYDADHPILTYYLDDHVNLLSSVQLLENHGLARDITHNNTKRFMIREEFARYLGHRHVLATETSTPVALAEHDG